MGLAGSLLKLAELVSRFGVEAYIGVFFSSDIGAIVLRGLQGGDSKT